MGNLSKNQLLKKLQTLLEFCEKNNFKNVLSNFKNVFEYMKNDTLNIIILGEVKRGKSSFVNALIGRSILPVGPVPTTATINILKYSKDEKIIVYYVSGQMDELPLTETTLKKYVASDDFNSENIKYIELYLNSDILKNNAVIIDTPGVNDICQTRSEITYGFIPLIDLAIFIFDPSQPVSRSEKEFIESRFIKKANSKVIFTLGKIDKIKSSDDIAKTVTYCSEKLSKIMNYNSSECEIIPFSTNQYLKDDGNQNNGFFKIKEGIENYISSANTNERKITILELTVKNIEEAIDQELKLQEEIINSRLKEKDQLRDRINHELKTKDEKFNNFNEYIDMVKINIINGAKKSIKVFSNELKDNLTHIIDTFQGNPKELVEKHLPYQIKMNLKSWTEKHQPYLQKGLKEIANQLIVQFQKNIGKSKLMKNIIVNISGNDDMSFNDVEMCDINAMKKSMQLNAAIMGVVGSILISPLAALPLVIVFNNYFGAQKIEEQTKTFKNNLMSNLGPGLDNCLSSYQNSVLMNINTFFNEITKNFKISYDEQYEEVLKKIRITDSEKNEIKEQYETLKSQFKNVI